MRRAVVTGASRGLGLEFVRQLLAAGGRVAATCRDPGGAHELASLAPRRAAAGAWWRWTSPTPPRWPW